MLLGQLLVFLVTASVVVTVVAATTLLLEGIIVVAFIGTSLMSAVLAAGAWSSWWLYSALLWCLPSLLLEPGHHGGSALHFSGVRPPWSWLSGLWQSSARVLLDFWAVQGVGDGTSLSKWYRWNRTGTSELLHRMAAAVVDSVVIPFTTISCTAFPSVIFRASMDLWAMHCLKLSHQGCQGKSGGKGSLTGSLSGILHCIISPPGT